MVCMPLFYGSPVATNSTKCLSLPLRRLRIHVRRTPLARVTFPGFRHKGGSQLMSEFKSRNGPGLSRRDFLRGSGAAAAATALTATPLPLAESPAAAPADATTVAMGPAPVKLQLDVNGTTMTTNVQPRVTPL